jgi:hypothetical protein
MKEYKVKVTDSKTEWYNLNDERHREDGPAIEFADGDKYWYINGERHREDGPAIEFADGDKSWYINGQRLTETEFNQRTDSCIGKIVEIDGKKYKLTQI